MNSYSFKNKWKTTHTEYIIQDIGLMKKINAQSLQSETFIAFESITSNKTHQLDRNTFLLTLTCVFFVASLVALIANAEPNGWLIWAAIMLICLLGYMNSRQRKLFIQTTQLPHVELWYTTNTRDTAESFADEVFSSRNAYLLSRYGTANKLLDYAPQLENLNWLLSNRVISKDVFDQKVAELNRIFGVSSTGAQIGFSPK